jgi:hypothetical protein
MGMEGQHDEAQSDDEGMTEGGPCYWLCCATRRRVNLRRDSTLSDDELAEAEETHEMMCAMVQYVVRDMNGQLYTELMQGL